MSTGPFETSASNLDNDARKTADQSWDSPFHTLGKGATQAAPGNHKHTDLVGGTVKEVFIGPNTPPEGSDIVLWVDTSEQPVKAPAFRGGMEDVQFTDGMGQIAHGLGRVPVTCQASFGFGYRQTGGSIGVGGNGVIVPTATHFWVCAEFPAGTPHNGVAHISWFVA
jgi:hypothetical protein